MEPGLGEKEGEKEEEKEEEKEKEKSKEGEEEGSLFDTYPLSTTEDSGKLVFQEISHPNFIYIFNHRERKRSGKAYLICTQPTSLLINW